MGMMYRGQSVNEALSTYAILTIGDGLCSQIPSLLISLSTGILVTKASSEGELGDEMVGQLFSIDRVLIMVGAALAFLGVLTPLPIYIFVPLGILLIVYGRKLKDKSGEATIEESRKMLFHCLTLILLSLSLVMVLFHLPMLIRVVIFLTVLL